MVLSMLISILGGHWSIERLSNMLGVSWLLSSWDRNQTLDYLPLGAEPWALSHLQLNNRAAPRTSAVHWVPCGQAPRKAPSKHYSFSPSCTSVKFKSLLPCYHTNARISSIYTSLRVISNTSCQQRVKKKKISPMFASILWQDNLSLLFLFKEKHRLLETNDAN